jgi:hypothetical protein
MRTLPPSKFAFLPLGLALTLVSLARADYNPVGLTPGSFNADVVVEKTASAPLPAFANATMDAGTNNTGSTFYEMGYANFPLAGAALATGLPHPGTVIAAVSNANYTFQMPSDYAANNAVLIGPYTGFTTGTLTLTAPAPRAALSVLAAAGNGPETNTVTVHYAGGSTQVLTLVVEDWTVGSSNIVWFSNGRVDLGNGNLGSLAPVNGTNRRLLRYDIALTDTVNNVTSIDFAYACGGRAAIFGLSGSTDGATFTPMTVTGFNRDMIVEASAPKCGFTPTVSVTLDGGPSVSGSTFYETGFNGNTDGLPHPGANVVYGNHTWTMASSYTANDCAFVGDYDGLRTATVTLNSASALSGLSFLTAAGNGPTAISVTVTHAGGGAETFTISSLDWGNNSSVAFTAGGRAAPNGLGRGTTFYLHPADIVLADTVDPVTSIAFTWVSTGRAAIYAIAGQSTAGGNYSPVAVAGWNGDSIIEKAATPTAPLYTATTVSMDGGTNNSANTWYEQGYYPTYPSSGLPAAGSTITSASLSDHHYTMAPSYTANNAVFVDAAHPTANLTPASAAAYSAISFLSATANGRVTNACIMQYADHTIETNFFISQDWFGNLPVAFYANGRVDLNTRLLNSVSTAPGNPRLYEAQFALGNTMSPLTNVVLQFLGAQNSTPPNDGRMMVFAVGATAGAVAPILVGGTPASPPLMLEGTNLVLTAQLTGGTAPIITTWYFSSDGGTNWAAVTNGGAFSGATTPSLTNGSVSLAQAGLYELVAQNVAGSVTSSVATVTVLSGLPDVTLPGDPITAYQPNGGSSPGGEAVTYAIDNNTSKYLNFAAGSSPFVGPIGFVVTPSLGKTVVSVLRFYTANDASERDPADYTLEGSDDGGANWTTISSGALALPTDRNGAPAALNPLTQYLQEVRFANATGYTSYRVSWATIRDNAGTPLTQLGEVELLGVRSPQAPLITLQPVGGSKVFVGAATTFYVAAEGYPSPSYQWYLNGATLIPNATNASYTFPSAQLADSGKTFSCTIANSAGTTNSSSATLTVVARPTQAYPVAVLADNPAAFWRMDETPDNAAGNNGVVASDYVGGHSGTYNNTVLDAAGYNPLIDADTAATFGSFANPDSYVGAIPDLSFAASNNSAATFSVEAWVKGPAQTVDAGILTKGAGGGGEQYNLDCGAGAHGFRFFVRNASGGAAGASGTKGPDGNWHHVVGVCDQVHSNIVLYVDGISNAVGAATASGILNSTHPVSLGARQSGAATGYDLQFNGTIDEAAVYAVALTPSQVLAHYYAANPPPVLSLNPTNTTAPEGTTATFYSLAYGPGTLACQWYESVDGGSSFAPMAGKTSPNLALTNVPNPSPNPPPQYQVVVTNAYGAVTSSVATLNVISGPPQILTDLPSELLVYAGRTVTLAVSVAGTAPFTYRWQSNGVDMADGGRFSGTQTNALTIANVQPGDGAYYQVFVSNSLSQSQGGPLPSAVTALHVETTPAFNTSGLGWTLNNGAVISSDMLTLTDGGGGETRSGFYNYPLNIDAFQASFTYQDVGGGGADGMAFVLQNDPRGPLALGGGGGELALSGITPSAALTFNIYGTAGMSLGLNGGNGSPYQATAPVDIASGHHIKIALRYANGTAQVSLTDVEFALTYTTTLAINFPAVVGADTAYVGFTGATGGVTSTQTVTDFAFTSYPILAAKFTAPDTVVVSWPASIGGFKLQGKPSLTAGSWADIAAPVNVVGGQNQVVVSPATGIEFYRLVLQDVP